MSKLLHVPREIAKNLLMAIPSIRDRRIRRGRTTAGNQAALIREQFDFFRRRLSGIHGTVVEIGPGDTVALAPLFLANGASQYIAYDRFLGDVFGHHQQSLYRDLGLNISLFQNRIALRRISIEESRDRDVADILISYNVIEHLTDPHLALRNMARMLKPNGVMIHRVDYGPHDCWTLYEDERTFMSFPDWLWRMMGSNRGYPNRERHSSILRTLQGVGLEVSSSITSTFKNSDDALDAELICIKR